MPPAFRASDPSDLPAIQSLLQSAFHTGSDSPNLDAALLRWKYYDTGPQWEGSRSYMLEKEGGALLAHGSLWPLRIGGIPAANLLDWAAVRFPPGMGVSLVRKLSEIAPLLISTGGSKATRAIMPRIGFQPVINQNIYVRVLRPWKQHRTRPNRSLARLARNFVWSIPSRVPLRQWSVQPADSLPDPAANHLLRCPSATVSAWTLQHAGRSGYFVLSRVAGQSRIARLRLDSASTGDLQAAYALAVEAALQDPEACELVALSSRQETNQALEANHFHFRDQRPVFVHDSKGLIPPAARPLELDMLDDDMAYLNVPEYPYFT